VSALSSAKTILEADATLLATATGGIWSYDETGRQGLSRTITPAAFDSNGVIRPCILLKMRDAIPDGQLADDASQTVSLREMLEAWFYQDTGYAAIETMRDRVYVKLQAVQLTGTYGCWWAGDIRGARDTELDASVERADYLVRRRR
jgi:hypothetical protein